VIDPDPTRCISLVLSQDLDLPENQRREFRFLAPTARISSKIQRLCLEAEKADSEGDRAERLKLYEQAVEMLQDQLAPEWWLVIDEKDQSREREDFPDLLQEMDVWEMLYQLRDLPNLTLGEKKRSALRSSANSASSAQSAPTDAETARPRVTESKSYASSATETESANAGAAEAERPTPASPAEGAEKSSASHAMGSGGIA